jgi:site-specific DNA-methyltransferase (adenine-specific)
MGGVEKNTVRVSNAGSNPSFQKRKVKKLLNKSTAKPTRLLACKFNIHEATPTKVYEELNKEFEFDFDPCPLNSTTDGLSINWGKRVYVNPPYGKAIRGWLEKALIELEKETEIVVFLLPANTDVKWFHEIVLPKASEIRFIKGRLKFGEHNNSAPFASMFVIFKKELSKQGAKK